MSAHHTTHHKKGHHHVKSWAAWAIVGMCVAAFGLYIGHEWATLPKPPPPAFVGPFPPHFVLPHHASSSGVTMAGEPWTRAGFAMVTAVSLPVFEYAHGTVMADGQFFIGMRDSVGNPFPTNIVVILTDPSDLHKYRVASLGEAGAVESAIYDDRNDKVYVMLAGNSALRIYSIDPQTYAVSTVLSTTSLDTGDRPAIVTDGTYIYGITNTERSTVFKVRISDGALWTDAGGHVPYGHSAAIGVYRGKTELYFGGGISHEVEKVDPANLYTIAEIKIPACNMTDDMPFAPIDGRSGYIYVGCEDNPYGERVRTDDMSVEQFALPGKSYGLFVYGNDLYNAARDGYIDAFPGGDIHKLQRFRVAGGPIPLRPGGSELQVNELFYADATESMYFTAWLGMPGLFRVSTTTASDI